MSQCPNRILNALPQEVFAAVEPHLQPVKLSFAEVVAETNQLIRRVYFPFSGVVSLVVDMSVGDMIETAMIGRDGVVNGTSALDGRTALHRGIVRVAGEAAAVHPNALRKLATEFEALHAILIRHEQVLLAQVQQSAACNASHSVEARMCRWLLRMHDLTNSEELTLTQEFLAQMLGVRRTSVSVVAGTLQKAGFIQYKRGNIRFLDIERLMEGSCECYATVKRHYERMLGM